MFAGIDELGRAQWVNITPGEEARTLEEIAVDEGFENTRYCLLAMEGELAESRMVAKVLAKVMECPIDEVSADMAHTLMHMQQMGVKWDQKPLELEVRVFENPQGGRRRGKYSFWLGDDSFGGCIFADVDGFDELDELFRWIRMLFLVLETNAGISIGKKYLRISDELKKKANRYEVGIYDRVEKETFNFKN
jgi:hypothetical protein